MKNHTSPYLEQAEDLLKEVTGKRLSVDERKRLSVELASYIIRQAEREITREERKEQKKLAAMMQDPIGKPFSVSLTDECFRSSRPFRVADQMIYLLETYGIPTFLTPFRKMQLFLFRIFGKLLAPILVPLVIRGLRKEASKVILPAESTALSKHIAKRKEQKVRININHLGEAILSEQEAERRFQTYLADLEGPDVDYISIKISTIYSQINFIAWDDSLEEMAKRLRILYRAAKNNPITKADGSKAYKFINFDMEEYRDLHLTVDLFRKILEEEEFRDLPAGIVLQAYIPDSFPIQKELTEWAKKRVNNGGAHIKVRIVKGANLAMEQVEASIRNWPQTPYTSKVEVDANFKRMVTYGMQAENAKAVHLGIGSHNIFDIAFAMLLRAENQVEPYTEFEMLEGMADHIRRVVQDLVGTVLLYCPVAKREDFRYAIAYLIRRLDENTGSENFLRHLFYLKPGSPDWESQVSLFNESCGEISSVSQEPRRKQNRKQHNGKKPLEENFDNEPDTDFSLRQNHSWAREILEEYKKKSFDPLPNVIAGDELRSNQKGKAVDPSHPGKEFFSYMVAGKEEIEKAVSTAKEREKQWSQVSLHDRCHMLQVAAQLMRERRKDLLGVMMREGGKIFTESDVELSEAIDNIEYYLRMMKKFDGIKDLNFQPRGTVLVTPPWNFPAAIPTGGVAAGLVTGNCVLFKPAPEAVLTGWHLAKIFWEAGFSKEVLQFIQCEDEPVGSSLIKDERINLVVLTGATATAELFLELRPGIELAAETGGKNSMIITALADRDLAIKDLIHSAFGHAGQKCSATSLLILDKELYDDVHFLRQVREAAASLHVGEADHPATKVPPLIRPPSEKLKRAMTTLEEGESWLLQPKEDPDNPHLWTPGIKVGVRKGSYTHMTEFFGPLLGVMRAESIEEAVSMANAVPYGLTAGLHSLDEREQNYWVKNIVAGNLYINRTMTGAIVKRQPFGGCKASSFGRGVKAGGPNYIREFLEMEQNSIPKEKKPIGEKVNHLADFLHDLELSADQLGKWYGSVANYSYWWHEMEKKRDPTKLIGQDNFFFYKPRKKILFRINGEEDPVDVLLVCAAALTCHAEMELSWSREENAIDWNKLSSLLSVLQEKESHLIARIGQGKYERIRVIAPMSEDLLEASSKAHLSIVKDPLLSNGRIELLNYAREVALSVDYHRYGNLGLRENEIRKPLP